MARAIAATFHRRETAIPLEPPFALTPAFAAMPDNEQQWKAFAADLAEKPDSFESIIRELADFLIPHARAATKLRGDSA